MLIKQNLNFSKLSSRYSSAERADLRLDAYFLASAYYLYRCKKPFIRLPLTTQGKTSDVALAKSAAAINTVGMKSNQTKNKLPKNFQFEFAKLNCIPGHPFHKKSHFHS